MKNNEIFFTFLWSFSYYIDENIIENFTKKKNSMDFCKNWVTVKSYKKSFVRFINQFHD